MTDWFVPNADQLLALTGRRDLDPAIKDVIALGTTAVAVTCGAEGCLVTGPGHQAPVYLPALEVEVVDTTGCGDGFTAGLPAGPAGRDRARRRRLAWPRLRRPGRDRPGLGRRHREPRPGAQLSGAHAAGRGQPDQGQHEGVHLMSDGTADRQLRERARAVIPGGMYGHQAAPGARLPAVHAGRPAGRGSGTRTERVRRPDVRSYGPVVLGHQHPKVEAAAARQAATGDCMNAPGPVMVDLAELLTQTVRHAGLGDTRQERYRRHHHVLHDRPGADRAEQDPRGQGRLPRRRALVHAAPGLDYRGRPRQPRPLHLQRPGQRAAGRRRGWR